MLLPDRGALLPDAAQRQVGLGVACALDAVDDEVELGRGQRLTCPRSRDPRRILEQRTCSRVSVLLISACEPPRSTMATSFEPEPSSVRRKPLPMARNDSSTITTNAMATTVESESQKRCGMLLRLIAVDGERSAAEASAWVSLLRVRLRS